MLNNVKLSKKFNIFLISVFLVAVTFSGMAFSAILNHSAETEITDKANLLLQNMLSVREYTLAQVNPLLAPQLETAAKFLPQTVPGYAAREVAEDLQKNPAYRNFFYKEATLNPTNQRDKADGFEISLVEDFKRKDNLKELSGYRASPGGELFYIARPIKITQASCLRCHSTPEKAPKSQIATYGSTNGFGWEMNEVVGAQVISVPASDVRAKAHQALLIFMAIVTGAFAVILLVVNALLRQSVIQPLNRISQAANEVSMGNLDVNFEQRSNDEIGRLSDAFNRMKTSLVMAMNMLNDESS